MAVPFSPCGHAQIDGEGSYGSAQSSAEVVSRVTLGLVANGRSGISPNLAVQPELAGTGTGVTLAPTWRRGR